MRPGAELQAGLGAVNGTRVHVLASVAMAGAILVLGLVGFGLTHSRIGQLAGAAVGGLVGGVVFDRMMSRAMRPHIVSYLERRGVKHHGSPLDGKVEK